MSIRLDDVFTWCKWDLPADLVKAGQQSYSSPEQAIGVLQGAQDWLVTHNPQDEKKITALFHAKIELLKNKKECRNLSNLILGPADLSKIPFYLLSPVLLPVFVLVDGLVAGLKGASLYAALKITTRDPEAAQAMEKLGILLPQEITPKNCHLLEELLWERSKEHLPEGDIIRRSFTQACEALRTNEETFLKEFITQDWVDAFQRIVESPQIQPRLFASAIFLPRITRENFYQIGKDLEERAKVNPFLKETLALIDKEMTAAEKSLQKETKLTHSETGEQPKPANDPDVPHQPSAKKLRVSGELSE